MGFPGLSSLDLKLINFEVNRIGDRINLASVVARALQSILRNKYFDIKLTFATTILTPHNLKIFESQALYELESILYGN